MSRIRVLDLAKELGLDTKSAIVKLQEIGIQVKNHFNALSEADADRFRNFVKSGGRTDKSSGSAKRMIIRRRSVQDESPSGGADKSSEHEAGSAGESTSEGDTLEESVAAAPAVTRKKSPLKREQEVSDAPAVAAASESDAKRVAKPKETPQAVADDPDRANDPAATSVPAEPTSSTAAEDVLSKTDEAVSTREVSESSQEPALEAQEAEDHSRSQSEGSSMAEPHVSPTRQYQPPPPPPRRSGTSQPQAAEGVAPRSQQRRQEYSAVIVRKAPPGQPAAAEERTSAGSGSGNSYTGSSAGGYHTRKPGDRPELRVQRDRDGGAGIGSRGGAGSAGGRDGDQGFRGTRRGGFEGDSSSSAEGAWNRGAGPRGRQPAPAPLAEIEPFGKEVGRRGDSSQKEKEREKQAKRKGFDESDSTRRGHGAGKGRARGAGLEVVEDVELDETEAAVADSGSGVRTVYTPTQQGRRGGTSAFRKRRGKGDRRHDASNTMPAKASKRIIKIDETISVSDLAGEMSVKASVVIKTLMQMGQMVTAAQTLDFDTATLAAQELGFETQNVTVSITDILQLKATEATDLKPRAPVVTVMGHVDHGKTSLLDAIRSSDVAGGESGGITQHIGAYQVRCKDRSITFLDTPGHEAFTAMRARGAKTTDIVVLVVAADDGVMPQTLEAISHARAAAVPIIVAINKIDKPGVNFDRVLADLSSHGVVPDDWGGDSIFVRVSAKTGEGIDDLLESIVLQSDVLELTTRDTGLASGVVIEGRLDKGRGPVATLLITEGCLNGADWIVAGSTCGRIRAMFNDRGEKILSAGPGVPVEVLGFDVVPSAGETFHSVVSDDVAKKAAAYREQKERDAELAARTKTTLEDILSRMAEESSVTKELPVILKADTQGSVEAIRSALEKLNSEKCRVKFIHSGVGGITETDVSLASTSGALVVGFNSRPDSNAASAAENSGVSIKFFSIIYELIDEVHQAMAGRLDPIRTEKVLGRAEVRDLFQVPKVGMVAGCAVLDGKVTRNAHMRVIRDGIVLYTGRVGSLRRFKEDAKEVKEGFECGIGVENYNDLKLNDLLEAFVIEEHAATMD